MTLRCCTACGRFCALCRFSDASKRGNGRTYTLRQLKRDRPDLAEKAVLYWHTAAPDDAAALATKPTPRHSILRIAALFKLLGRCDR